MAHPSKTLARCYANGKGRPSVVKATKEQVRLNCPLAVASLDGLLADAVSRALRCIRYSDSIAELCVRSHDPAVHHPTRQALMPLRFPIPLQMEKLSSLFRFYCQLGEKRNYQFMSRQQFLRFARDASLVSYDIDLIELDLLFDKVIMENGMPNLEDIPAGPWRLSPPLPPPPACTPT